VTVADHYTVPWSIQFVMMMMMVVVVLAAAYDKHS
jgi:hypothetical protein